MLVLPVGVPELQPVKCCFSTSEVYFCQNYGCVAAAERGIILQVAARTGLFETLSYYNVSIRLCGAVQQ